MDVREYRPEGFVNIHSNLNTLMQTEKASDCIFDGWVGVTAASVRTTLSPSEEKHTVKDMHSLASYMGHVRAHWLNEI